MDWIPPCFSVPKKVVEIIEKGNLRSDVLHQISIPRDNKFSGKNNQILFLILNTKCIIFSN